MTITTVPLQSVAHGEGARTNGSTTGGLWRALGAPMGGQPDLTSRHDTLEFRKGELIYGVGDPAGGIYLVQSGRVKIYRLWEDGREITLGIVGRDDVFGEECVVTRDVFNTFAEALEAVRLVFVHRNEVLARLARQPGVATELMRITSERLIAAQMQLESLAFRRVTSRVADLLVRMVDAQWDGSTREILLHPGLTHQQMASLLGTTRETFTSTLSKLADLHILTSSRKGVQILDLGALRRIC